MSLPISAVITMVVMIAMNRTPFATFGILIAMFEGSVIPAIFDWTDVTLARDISEIPGQLPLPIFLDLSGPSVTWCHR